MIIERCVKLYRMQEMYRKNNYELTMKVTNSHKHLLKALYNLIRRQSFEVTTVKDICLEANVSRSNFYNHFEDKYHLLLFYFEVVRLDLNNKLYLEKQALNFEGVLEYIKNNDAFFKSLISTDDVNELTKLLDGIIFQDILAYLQERGMAEQHDQEMEVTFLTGGTSWLLHWWIANDFVTSQSEVIRLLEEMFARRSKFTLKKTS